MSTIRLCGFVTSGIGLTVSRIRAFAGAAELTISRVTATFSPSAGVLTDLILSAGSECVWPANVAQYPGFAIVVDVPVSVTRIELETTAAHLQDADGLYALLPSPVAGVVVLYKKVNGAFWQKQSLVDLAPDIFVPLPPFVDLGGKAVTRSNGVVLTTPLSVDGEGAWAGGSGALVRVAAVGAVDAGSFTLSIDLSGTANGNTVVVEHGTNNQGWSLQTDTPNRGQGVHLNIGSGGGANYTGYTCDIPVFDGVPHRLVIRFFKPTMSVSMFVDGVAASVTRRLEMLAPPVYDTSYIDFGSRGGSIAPMPSSMAVSNFALYARALSDAECAQLASRVPYPRSWLVGAGHLLPMAAVHEQGLVPQVVGLMAAQDLEHGGHGCIHGTVEQKLTSDTTLPLKRRVRLHRSRDGMLVRETWSDENGHYRFDGLNTRYEYDVIAWDHEGQFRSTIANNIKPEVQP